MSIDFNNDEIGTLSIEESGAVVAMTGELAVAVKLSPVEMRQFASMLQRAASFIERNKPFVNVTEIEVKRVGGGGA